MARMQAVYYRASDGSEPVDEFIEALHDPGKQAVLDNQIDRLNMDAPRRRPLRPAGHDVPYAACPYQFW